MDRDVADGIGSIWAGHFEAQERRLAVLEQAIVSVVAGALDDGAQQDAQQAAHKLAGSLGTFGLEHGSQIAAQIETALKAQTLEWSELGSLARSVASLRALLEEHRPAADAAPVAAPAAATATATGESTDIWLVDDDDIFARYVLEPLQRRYRVTWLSSGESALAAVARASKEQYPRLILLDIEMPGIKGLNVLEQLATLGVAGQCAVVMLTRRTVVEDVVRARQLGAFDFLAKPISVQTLTERVGRALTATKLLSTHPQGV